jgi:hypothetical protein
MTERFTKLILKLGNVDRRWVYLVIAIVVLLPIFFPLGLPVRPTKASQDVYDAIEALPHGSKVLLSLEYGPSTKPEIHPMTLAVLRQLFRNKQKVYITCLWPDGQFMAEDALSEITKEFNVQYGIDYVLLGYRPGAEAIIKGIVSDLRKVYSVDARGTLVTEIPMMKGVTRLKDFAFIFSASAGYPGTVEWVQYGSDPTGVPMSTGVSSIQVNEVMPYVQSGQIKGILAGMPGAAEYEALIGVPGIGTSGMDAQSIAHLVIIAFIIFGNIAFFIERRQAKKH